MYTVTDLFVKLNNSLVSVIPKLIDANAASRNELVEVVSALAAEVQEGLGLVETYIRGALYLDTQQDLGRHFFEVEKSLYRYHSEFKICRGLRQIRDRFGRMFDAMPHSIALGERKQIELALSELQLEESMILEEFGNLWPRLHDVIQTRSVTDAKEFIKSELAEVDERKRRIGELAKGILNSF